MSYDGLEYGYDRKKIGPRHKAMLDIACHRSGLVSLKEEEEYTIYLKWEDLDDPKDPYDEWYEKYMAEQKNRVGVDMKDDDYSKYVSTLSSPVKIIIHCIFGFIALVAFLFFVEDYSTNLEEKQAIMDSYRNDPAQTTSTKKTITIRVYEY